jgi:hypothetical protein
MSETQDLVGCGYDAVYEAFPNSPTLRRLWRDNAAGRDFPDVFYHISFLTVAELTRMSAELRLTGEMTSWILGAAWQGRATGSPSNLGRA